MTRILSLFILLGCLSCFGQFGVEQPFFLSQAPSAMPFTNPLSITGLKMWLNITNCLNDSYSTPSDGDKILVWLDQSGNGNHATNANYPAYYGGKFKLGGGPNGSNYCDFNGASFYTGAYTNTVNLANTNTNPWSAVFVLKSRNLGLPDSYVYYLLGAGTAPIAHLTMKGDGTAYRIDTDTVGPTTISTASWYELILTGNGTTAVMFTNGVQYATGNLASAGHTEKNRAHVWGIVDSGHFGGYGLEVLIYSGILTAENISDLTTYYRGLYGF